MPRARKSGPVRRDIDEITSYIARDSVDAALRWLEELDAFLERVAAVPGMGTSRESFRPGLRSVPFGKYLVFFRKSRGGIEIARIIHGARKWQRVMKNLE